MIIISQNKYFSITTCFHSWYILCVARPHACTTKRTSFLFWKADLFLRVSFVKETWCFTKITFHETGSARQNPLYSSSPPPPPPFPTAPPPPAPASSSDEHDLRERESSYRMLVNILQVSFMIDMLTSKFGSEQTLFLAFWCGENQLNHCAKWHFESFTCPACTVLWCDKILKSLLYIQQRTYFLEFLPVQLAQNHVANKWNPQQSGCWLLIWLCKINAMLTFESVYLSSLRRVVLPTSAFLLMFPGRPVHIHT